MVFGEWWMHACNFTILVEFDGTLRYYTQSWFIKSLRTIILNTLNDITSIINWKIELQFNSLYKSSKEEWWVVLWKWHIISSCLSLSLLLLSYSPLLKVINFHGIEVIMVWVLLVPQLSIWVIIYNICDSFFDFNLYIITILVLFSFLPLPHFLA